MLPSSRIGLRRSHEVVSRAARPLSHLAPRTYFTSEFHDANLPCESKGRHPSEESRASSPARADTAPTYRDAAAVAASTPPPPGFPVKSPSGGKDPLAPMPPSDVMTSAAAARARQQRMLVALDRPAPALDERERIALVSSLIEAGFAYEGAAREWRFRWGGGGGGPVAISVAVGELGGVAVEAAGVPSADGERFVRRALGAARAAAAVHTTAGAEPSEERAEAVEREPPLPDELRAFARQLVAWAADRALAAFGGRGGRGGVA